MIVSNEFRPDPRLLKEAKTLTRLGDTVSVLAWDREASGLLRYQMVNGIEVRRLSVPGGRYGTGLRQILGYLLFSMYALAFLVVRRAKMDVLHVHEADLLPIGVLARWVLARPLIADFHELYSGRDNGQMPRIMGFIERSCLKHVDALVVVNEAQATFYRPLLKPGANVAVVPNYPEAEHLRHAGPRSSRLTVSFFGNVRNAREIITLVEAAQRVPGLHVLVAGHGPQATEVARYMAAVPNGRYLGPFSYEQQPDLYSQSHIVYAVCALDRNMVDAYPVKMWEGLICGQPVIVGKGSAAEELLVAHHAGCGATGTDVEELVTVLQTICERHREMSENARILGATHTWELAVKEMLKVYASIRSEASEG